MYINGTQTSWNRHRTHPHPHPHPYAQYNRISSPHHKNAHSLENQTKPKQYNFNRNDSTDFFRDEIYRLLQIRFSWYQFSVLFPPRSVQYRGGHLNDRFHFFCEYFHVFISHICWFVLFFTNFPFDFIVTSSVWMRVDVLSYCKCWKNGCENVFVCCVRFIYKHKDQCIYRHVCIRISWSSSSSSYTSRRYRNIHIANLDSNVFCIHIVCIASKAYETTET